MNRIDQKFIELRNQKKKAFIAFITAGDPNLRVTEELVLAFEQSGVDIVELGVPFSDPMADGPTIQASSERALKKHVNLHQILTTVQKIRQKSQIPIALMTYYNPIFHFGEERFMEYCARVGVDGVIIPDLPPEEAKSLMTFAKRKKISTVFFLAPTTRAHRMKKIINAATGFIYYVSLTGVTGAKKEISSSVLKHIALAKKMTKKPICVGFGVSTAEQVKIFGRVADGVIVGSAIVCEIYKNAGKRDLVDRVAKFVKTLTKSGK